MYKVRTYNQISVKGLEQLPCDYYEAGSEIAAPDALLLRSHKLAAVDIAASVKAIGRAGAGVNNLPIPFCTERGIPVFNAPGANANAVKELVLASMLLASRGILPGITYVNTLSSMTDATELSKLLEREKKRFRGHELVGRTLGVVGLGATGSRVARMGLTLGMDVVGYDPALSVEAAWRLPSDVRKIDHLSTLFSICDYVSLHLPVLESTRNLINSETVRSFKKGAVLLNFAREEIVEASAVCEALDAGTLGRFVSDFPHPLLIERDDVIFMPHIGASTDEAEENCAIMVAQQLRDFLENGNIRNAVNFPTLVLERTSGYRIAVTNCNVPRMLGSLTAVLADADINVIDMVNKSRDEIAYNLIDVAECPDDVVIAAMKQIEGVINVRIV